MAAGDNTGRILIWRGFGDKTFAGNKSENENLLKDEDEKPGVRGNGDADSCTTWHWHSSEVKVLSFSSDGVYLYSGKKMTSCFSNLYILLWLYLLLCNSSNDRWKRRSSCSMAARYWKEKILTPNRDSITLL